MSVRYPSTPHFRKFRERIFAPRAGDSNGLERLPSIVGGRVRIFWRGVVCHLLVARASSN